MRVPEPILNEFEKRKQNKSKFFRDKAQEEFGIKATKEKKLKSVSGVRK